MNRSQRRPAGAFVEKLEFRRLLAADPVNVTTTGDPPAVVSAAYRTETSMRVSAQFSQDVLASINSADLELLNLTDGKKYSLSIVTKTGGTGPTSASWTTIPEFRLPDGNYRATIKADGIFNNSGVKLDADHVLEFFVLDGDANRDRRVDEADRALVDANTGLAGGTFFQGDVNYDGNIDAADRAIIQRNWYARLPEQGSIANLSATLGSDSYRIRRGTITGGRSVLATIDVYTALFQQAPAYRIIAGAASSIAFDGRGGADQLTILTTDGAEDIVFDADAVTLAGSRIEHSNVEFFAYDGYGAGGDAQGAPDSLTINSGLVVLSGSARLSSLEIGPEGQLSMHLASVIVDYPAGAASPIGVATAAGYAGLTGLIADGRIILPDAGLRALGVAEAADVLGLSGAQTQIWGAHRADATSVLIKRTYAGDANLDGFINIDDYGRIDANVAQSGSVWGWFNGDFNYDGLINIDDYGIIDANISQQVGTAATGAASEQARGTGERSTAVFGTVAWGGDAKTDETRHLDYGRIDSNVAQSGSVWGWFNGDFNYDGAINIDDYGIIDGNMSQQDSIL